jgi:hypothetical protein
MSSSRLHASFALAATMQILVLTMLVWDVFARSLPISQNTLLIFICPKRPIGVVCGCLPSLVFLRHWKSSGIDKD